MKRRLYFLIPTVYSAKKVFNQLLLHRVPIQHIRFVANDAVDLSDLPRANLLQQYDVMHSMLIGLGIGALMGIGAGILAHYALGMVIGGGMIATTLVGAVIGGWSASMIGLMVPNSHHKPFHKAINEGKLLMLVDIPKERMTQIQTLARRVDHQIDYQGIEPRIPAFP